MNDVLERLAAVIEERRQGDPALSYVAGLCAGGLDRILKKVGEEAAETLIAAKNGESGALVHESADLLFHLIVLLKFMDIEPAEVLAELERRFGHSGLAEKAARNGKPA